MTKELLSKLLHSAADNVIENKCGLDEEELEEISKILLHKKVTLEQLCNILGISRATLNRRIKDNIYPEPRKDSGGKKYYWEDEILNIKV